MKIVKKILLGIISIFAIVLMILIKIVTVLLLIPLKPFKLLFKMAAGLLNIVCWIGATLIAIAYIAILVSGAFTENSPVSMHIFMISSILILASIPIWLLGPIELFMDWLEKMYYVILRLPVTFFTSFSFKVENEESQSYEYYENYEDAEEEKSKNKIKASNDLENLFTGIKNRQELHKRYKDLLKIYHPDNQSGDTAMTQRIQEAYDKLLNSGDFI